MPPDVVRDATPREVTPVVGEGALGTWLSHKSRTRRAGVLALRRIRE